MRYDFSPLRTALGVLGLTSLVGLAGCSKLGIDTADESSTGEPDTTVAPTENTTPPESTTFDLECLPGEERCASDGVKEECKPTGLGWNQIECGQFQACQEDANAGTAECKGPCETLTENSLGCEFLAIRMRSANTNDAPEDADAIIVGNTDETKSAEVKLFLIPNYFNEEEQQGDTITLGPGESHLFTLTNSVMPNYSSFRAGGVYHVVSDYPVSAYLHSPIANSASNDASLLLPVKALGTEHIITSFPPFADANKPDTNNGRPSYFNIIATENDTEVEWTPRSDTAGDQIAVFKVAAKETGRMKLNRFDVIQVGASSISGVPLKDQDVSGTIIRSTKPIVVMGATACARIPYGGTGGCNHLQEQVIPIKYWGERYAAPHSPVRGVEKHYWRVFAGGNNQTIVVEPKVPGLPPFTLTERGQFKDIVVANGFNTVFKSNQPFMAVQYLAGGAETGVNVGDPAMYQTIPIEQHLKRYVFVTGANYDENYVQVIRQFNGPDVFIDGEAVTGWTSINSTGMPPIHVEVADVPLGPTDEAGVHLATSDGAFGINVIGFVKNSAYAYPGGMGLKVINPEGPPP